MSLWAFRFLLWFIVVAYVQPQNRFEFLNSVHLADISGMGAIGLHVMSAAREGRPFIRFGPCTILCLAIMTCGLIAQYTGALQTDPTWNYDIDMLIKTCVVGILVEAMAFTNERVWAIQATLLVALLWWIKAGLRLSSAGATYMGDRIMGPAVSMIENPNGYAYLTAVYIPLFFYFYRQERRFLWKLGYGFLIFAGIFIVLQTGSRTGLICLLVMGAFTIPMLAVAERKFLIIAVIGIYIVIGAVSKGNIERFKSIRYAVNSFIMGKPSRANSEEDKNTVERYYRNKHTWNLIKMYPLGTGMNPNPDLMPAEVGFATGKSHMEILMAGRMMGFPGMFLYLLMLAIPFIKGRQIQRTMAHHMPGLSDLGWLFKIQAAIFLTGGLFVPNPFIYPETIMLGCASALSLNTSSSPEPSPAAPG